MKKIFKVAGISLASLLALDAMAGAKIKQSSAPKHGDADVVIDRAAWLRGTWGINWKPVDLYNGKSETLSIDLFLESISHLKTIDYLQLHLNDSYIKSPVHIAPHEILESLWQGDTDTDGKPINLVVPRAATGVDPFLEMAKATQAAGLKVQVYVNSSNMLERGADIANPASFPNITERWKAYCDSDPEVQAFIASQAYHDDPEFPERKYMFAYAEFVLKTYAERYGDLINAWLFDSGTFMEQNGDNATNGLKEDQLIYKAFADAVHAGNPNAAVSFNNGPERETEALNPFSEATHYDDYMFGHPYNGGRYIGNHDNGIYERNYAHIQKITETNGNVHEGGEWEWDDKVVGHFDPPMSQTRWNSGIDPGLTDEEFVQWNYESAVGGGAISWGAPLYSPPGSGEQLLIRDWAMAQLELMDAHLASNQEPGAPNWARAHTALADAIFVEPYSQSLVEGVDFWDPEGDAVTLALLPKGAPSWLSLEEDLLNPGTWVLTGTPTELVATEYKFVIQATDGTNVAERTVTLTVDEAPNPYPVKGATEVFATPNTHYGTDGIATMVSSLQTAPDGLATFQFAFDVVPMLGGSIQSGTSGGSTTEVSWAVGDDKLMLGSEAESIDAIDNLRVLSFEANGSCLTESNLAKLSFQSVEIVNGQSTGDRVLTTANGVINAEGGARMSSIVAKYYLNYASTDPITDVSLTVGNAKANNKWSVNNVEVAYELTQPSINQGDFNCDGVIDKSDKDLLVDALGSQRGDEHYLDGADFNNDGRVTGRDMQYFVREILDNKHASGHKAKAHKHADKHVRKSKNRHAAHLG